ncbi:hypothetical protein ERJ75_001065600 [Trypanosoma vivax]|nr:hypothetical protein ERJ75_001065600 [Trypanosoma vivax]
MVAYSNLEKVVKDVLLKADAVAESSRNQIKMIRHTFADAVHNITLTPTAGEAEVCGDRSDYEVRSSLKVAMESVLALNSMPDATELQTMLHSMQENVNTAINIRNEAKKHADAAVVASLKAQQMEAEVVCAPLFEQLLRHVW